MNRPRQLALLVRRQLRLRVGADSPAQRRESLIVEWRSWIGLIVKDYRARPRFCRRQIHRSQQHSQPDNQYATPDNHD
jgi:hypothetical protein